MFHLKGQFSLWQMLQTCTFLWPLWSWDPYSYYSKSFLKHWTVMQLSQSADGTHRYSFYLWAPLSHLWNTLTFQQHISYRSQVFGIGGWREGIRHWWRCKGEQGVVRTNTHWEQKGQLLLGLCFLATQWNEFQGPHWRCLLMRHVMQCYSKYLDKKCM